jgi:hypothetical protein
VDTGISRPRAGGFPAPSARFSTWFSTLGRFDALKSMIAAYRTFLASVRDRAVRAAYNEAQ